jgi:quinol monooxygenase YgiN
MEYLVLADFKTNVGMSDDMAAIFKEALVQTRAFDGCNAIDVYFEEKTTTYTMI